MWRLYEALDRTKPDQIAYYIKGVGTAGWRPFAALDGATGIGVPSNVRKLYRFLCWNWQPGDEIYIFGFSRGSFTARTLVGLIASQGLVPAMIDGSPVSHAEMQRNAMAAWREYRRNTVGYWSLPTIWLARLVRDIVLALYHFILWHSSYKQVRKAMVGREVVPIEFLGLFDTVEAFGVPIEELRTAIDWAIWPISFRNRRLSDRVVRARHALSLDDERTTFHPIRFEHPKGDERIKEVWFAGVHSDVGGGYPEGTLSYVPLVWMAEQVEHVLRFQPGQIDHFRAYQSAIGPIHDSRSGAAVMYRYGPRPIGVNEKTDGGPPAVHLSVVERMLYGCDDYAPVMLPASAEVLLPTGEVKPLIEDETRRAMKSAYESSARTQGTRSTAAAEAFVRMSPPDGNMVKLALDTVWWRRFWYFALLVTIALLAVWPLVARKVVALLSGSIGMVEVGRFNLLAFVTALDYRIGSVVGTTADFLLGFLPSYVEPWLKITVYYPTLTTIVIAVVATAWGMNAFLRDRIRERARLAWNRPHRSVADNLTASWLLKIGRFFRLYGWPLRMAFTNVAVPAIFLAVIFGVALLSGSRSYYNWRAGTGVFCKRANDVTPVGDQPVAATTSFDTRKLCWGSGLWVEKGRKYRIWIDAKDQQWFDRTIMSGVNGFKLYSSHHLLALPIRRWYRADWFQPVLRIGAEGDAELPLEAVNVMPADDLPRPLNPTNREDKKNKKPVRIEQTDEFKNADSELRRNWPKLGDDDPKFGRYDPIPDAALPAARRVWRDQGLADQMVADFVAAESGEMFLYVNDAIQFFPLFGPFELYYGNNSGAARVTLQRMPLPPPPGK
ncbi:DUF2235 domain-containing protein [Bradyrhizobium sediminis]|uniref:DUF2235 domain-containing protein n=1 Tax=Bradyrhizobium sediminis TaxID=2840469 RepID=UPI00201CAC3C|nr:DUF2235 domain-containing protein [Bradyrhizobium sediminis]